MYCAKKTYSLFSVTESYATMRTLIYSFLLLLFACSQPKKETPEENQIIVEPESSSASNSRELPPIENPKSIVDYYNLAKWKGMIDPFVFVKRDGQWICTEEMGKGFDYSGPLNSVRQYPAVVDIKNGYIKIDDEGTGGGTLLTSELALFRKSDNTYILAINGYGMDEITHEIGGSSPRFYVWINNEFKEVTQDVFPELQESSILKDESAPIESLTYFTLPQVGRSIEFHVQPSDTTKASALKSNKIEIQFDRSSDKFVVVE